MKDVFNAIAATKGVNGYAVEKKLNLPKMTAADIPALIERQKTEYPRGSVHMNMITNHDLNSWEGTEFERWTGNCGIRRVKLHITGHADDIHRTRSRLRPCIRILRTRFYTA